MQRTVKRDYWLISGLLFFFFFSWSSSYSLFSIWLHQVIGLNGAQTGYVFAANAIAALLIQPCRVCEEGLLVVKHFKRGGGYWY